MNNKLLFTIILILVLFVGLQAGYIYKMHQDKSLKARTSDVYRPITSAPNTASQQTAPAGFSTPGFSVSFGNTVHNPFGGGDPNEWDPFQEMEEMQKAMNQMFRQSYSRGVGSGFGTGHAMRYEPDWDVKETPSEYVIKLDLPGIDKDKVSVKVDAGQLVVSGERQMEKESSSDQDNFYSMERSFGSFARSMPMPADADSDKIAAESKDGVLTIRIPKKEAAA